jgi:HEAT repeat protein
MLPALLAALNDRDASVRGAVAAALANLGDQQAVEALRVRREEDESIHVKAALDRAIQKLISKTPIEEKS